MGVLVNISCSCGFSQNLASGPMRKGFSYTITFCTSCATYKSVVVEPEAPADAIEPDEIDPLSDFWFGDSVDLVDQLPHKKPSRPTLTRGSAEEDDRTVERIAREIEELLASSGDPRRRPAASVEPALIRECCPNCARQLRSIDQARETCPACGCAGLSFFPIGSID